MDDDMSKLMEKVVKARARQHVNRAKLFRVAQKVFETTLNPNAIMGLYNAAKAHSLGLAKELVAAGAATDYAFPSSEFAIEVTRLRDQQRADAKAKAAAKAAGRSSSQQENNQ